MSRITEISDAVTTVLNDNSFSSEFDAERLYQPIFELKDMNTLHVTVVSSGIPAMERASRGSNQRDYKIDIAVQKKYEDESNDELDPLMDLVEEIVNTFDGKRLAGVENAICIKTENKPVFAQEHMEQYRQFTSLVSLTFRVID